MKWVNTVLSCSFTDTVLLYFSQQPYEGKQWTQDLNQIYLPPESIKSFWACEPIGVPWVRKWGIGWGRELLVSQWFCLRLLSQLPSWHSSYCAYRLCRPGDMAYTLSLAVTLTFIYSANKIWENCHCSVKLLEFACLSISPSYLPSPLHFLTCKQSGGEQVTAGYSNQITLPCSAHPVIVNLKSCFGIY